MKDFIIDVLEREIASSGWLESAGTRENPAGPHQEKNIEVVNGPQHQNGPPREMASVYRRNGTYTASYRPAGRALSVHYQDYDCPQKAVAGIREAKRDHYRL